MKIGIMQPYFFPYIGYWQLINLVDVFVIYDNIEFTKQGWIRRNRILMNGKDKLISLPIKKDSDYLNINERYLSGSFKKERSKIINRIKAAYGKAPEFAVVFPIIQKALNYNQNNLFDFVYNSILLALDYLQINTKIIVSSTIDIDHSLKGKDRVIAICKALGGSTYINPIGGAGLYDVNEFKKEGIRLQFIEANSVRYKQFNNHFVPNLSIIDVMMFNPKSEVIRMLDCYSLK